jgi:dipeptidase
MGANEHGVTIGNEALLSHIPPPKGEALTGMDLVRLTLERAASAGEAVEILTTLLERHGQGGNCGHQVPSYYHNGFIIADACEAFVVETVERDWLIERVSTLRALSNEYTIDASLRDPEGSHVGSARARRERATTLLQSATGRITLADVIRILRDHDVSGQLGPSWTPRKDLPNSLCIHAVDASCLAQTTGSMASEIRAGSTVHWVTGTAAPCISLFKPAILGIPVPDQGPPPTARFDERTLWWAHEQLHRTALMHGLTDFIAEIASERDELEAQFRARIDAIRGQTCLDDRAHAVASCWADAARLEGEWMSRVRRTHRLADDT